MTVITIAGLLALGLAAGYFSGLVGIGGGVIIVPALVLMFGFTQYAAQGTTLALLVPPVGILAVWKYFQDGYVDIRTAAIICVGFVLGGYLGGTTAVSIPQETLRKVFGGLLIVLGIRMFFKA
ncbi:MAG: sulfite exporter TauE/SafE family protein [Bacteroidetes bacterium]|nr:sulfite exporter TauE/SafE family protein [Bacteroidota bacterium]MBS1977533.1 sulfite exporter TauE/SafE family protein [Bacteroidota bacterium]